jgi:hypothetical protein
VRWTSEKSGEGTQTITVSERPTRIETALDFGDMGQPDADWTFEPVGGIPTRTERKDGPENPM